MYKMVCRTAIAISCMALASHGRRVNNHLERSTAAFSPSSPTVHFNVGSPGLAARSGVSTRRDRHQQKVQLVAATEESLELPAIKVLKNNTPLSALRRPLQRLPRDAQQNAEQVSVHSFPQSLKALAGELCAGAEDGGYKAQALALIQLGDEWAREQEQCPKPDLELERVPSCLALVRIGVVVENGIVAGIRGTADARVSRGLIAFLARGLRGMKVEDILAIDPHELCVALSAYCIVSPNRALGFESMVEVIQQQLRQQQQPARTSRGPTELLQEDTWSGVGGEGEVAVLLSGGVDSSVAMQLAKDAGMKPRAFYLRIWLEDELSHLNECPWKEDLEYASATAAKLGVPLESLSMQQAYRDRVIEEVLKEVKAARTPNPDILCNSRIKFGMFVDQVGKHFDKIITGHYARVEKVEGGDEGEVGLFCSPDPVKDQTYFLSSLTQEQLRKVMFPIGEFQKSKVRDLASEFDLPTKARKDSQGLCFLGKLKWNEFLDHYLEEVPGEIRKLETGEVVGEHRGLFHHTLGQSRGLCVGGEGPWYVAAKDPEYNVVYITNNYSSLVAPRCKFAVDSVNWISGRPPHGLSTPGGSIEMDVKVRHGPNRHEDASVVRSIEEEGVYHITTKSMDIGGFTSGQYAAFYQGDRCLGAGIIRARPLRDLGVSSISKKRDPGGIKPAEKNELELLKQNIAKRKRELKESGMSREECNQDEQVLAWVSRLQDLKLLDVGQRPPNRRRDARAERRKRKLGKQMQQYRWRLEHEQGLSDEEMTADPHLQDLQTEFDKLPVYEFQ
mmetsp:Transcript_103564/g.194955  ORF Transcript_103564/g.194955 Transcript_103564/m.194955 type:complete len:788 (+) Transcript_103564:41-2404(+)